jgi:hypothetical protein
MPIRGRKCSTHKFHTKRGECIHLRDCICPERVAFEFIFASCVEPLPLSGGTSSFQVFWALLVVLSPFCLFLRASCVLLGCIEPLPMSLGTKLCKFCSFQMTLFWLFIGFWSFGWVLFSFLLFCFFCSPVNMYPCGIDKALIKGEIANTRSICTHVVRCFDEWLSMCWHFGLNLWTNRSVSLGCATCLSACGVQVWSSETVVDGGGKGQAGSCRCTQSGEGWTPGLGPRDRSHRVTSCGGWHLGTSTSVSVHGRVDCVDQVKTVVEQVEKRLWKSCRPGSRGRCWHMSSCGGCI